ncbi:MAG: leucine-rich repeat protein [Thermoguttaceae bacterium]|nr:leucine-rich repeat protein [Thermoguttaceae bacterium]
MPDYTVWAVLEMLLCCFPFGLAGLILSHQSMSANLARRSDIAEQKNLHAKQCLISGAIIGPCAIIMVFSMVTLGMLLMPITVIWKGNVVREIPDGTPRSRAAREIPTVRVASPTTDTTSPVRLAPVGSNSTIPENPAIDFEYAITNDEVIIRGFKNKMEKGAVRIPAQIEGLPVTTIGTRAFQWCGGLTSIIIPASVTTIKDNAFLWCDSLTSITIPTSVRTIEKCAFLRCDKLASITIQEGMTLIGDGAFAGCRRLKSIAIPTSVTSIGSGAFNGCEGLFTLTLPARVTNIGYGAFSDCFSLTSLTLPEGVTSIGGRAFQGCKNLTSIVIPKSVVHIGERAFYQCTELTIQTPAESAAETYAQKYAIPCMHSN